MKRYIQSHVINDLADKLVIIMGPRQGGKTTLAKQLGFSFDYLNYDSSQDRILLKDLSWDRSKELIIFDELHKKPKWKQWLKGIYDTEGLTPKLLVTGSAKLNSYRKVGDSLAGRYFSYRLHPFDLKELAQLIPETNETELFEQLYTCSGFPEPFLKGNIAYYRRWRSSHLDIILRQDLIDQYSVHDIKSIETLIVLLQQRVGSTISYANLARDLERDPNTIKRWLTMLEELYLIFSVTPYHHNIARSLLKEPKYYFYDYASIKDEGARLENIVACALKKELDFIKDTEGKTTGLYFLRTKDGIEIDFCICIDDKPTVMLEVKNSDDKPSSAFSYFRKFHPQIKSIQLVKNMLREKTFPDGLEIRMLVSWLKDFDLTQSFL